MRLLLLAAAAGKSTLMGRLLSELGQVSQKEVHKNQKESAQAGKVRATQQQQQQQHHML
jgi:translation elongation factor EF-1alpha